MNISEPFIHRPVATTLLTLAVAIAGAIGFSAAAGRFSHNLGFCQSSRRQR